MFTFALFGWNDSPIVEDDPLLQVMVEDALVEGGFLVAMVGSGEEAISLLKGPTSTYRALVTDINLQSTIDGWDFARVAREIDPAFPFI